MRGSLLQPPASNEPSLFETTRLMESDSNNGHCANMVRRPLSEMTTSSHKLISLGVRGVHMMLDGMLTMRRVWRLGSRLATLICAAVSGSSASISRVRFPSSCNPGASCMNKPQLGDKGVHVRCSEFQRFWAGNGNSSPVENEISAGMMASMDVRVDPRRDSVRARYSGDHAASNVFHNSWCTRARFRHGRHTEDNDTLHLALSGMCKELYVMENMCRMISTGSE